MLKYEAIANRLREEIQKGTYTPGQQLPLEKEMCATFDVSRITIKRAVDELVKQGLVVKRRGSGTFVKLMENNDVQEVSMANQFSGFSSTFPGHTITTKVLRFDIDHPTEQVADKLQIAVDDFVYQIERVRFLDGKPLVIEYTQMPIQLIPGIKMRVLENSIYHYIEDELGLKIQSAHRAIRADVPTEQEKQELHIKDNLPILEIAQVAFLDDGRPFEYSVARHRADESIYRTVCVR